MKKHTECRERWNKTISNYIFSFKEITVRPR